MLQALRKKIETHKGISFFTIYLVSFLFYYRFLSVYFTGDDFFHFKVAQTDGSLVSFFKLFGFYPFEIRGIAFYRPLLREALYHVYYSLFGLSSIPFRITQLLIFFTTIYLVEAFAYKLAKDKLISFLSTFLYGISAAHVGSLYYLAGGIQAQGAALFLLLSLVYKERRIKSFIFFVLGLMSHELAIVTPVLLICLAFIDQKKLSLQILVGLFKKYWAFILISILYLSLNIFVIGFSSSETQYQANFAPATLANTLMWYTGWSLGLPEMLVDFVGSGFRLNPNLMKYWGEYFKIIFPAFFVFLISIIGVFFMSVKKLKKDKIVFFLIAWFALALIPVIPLPLHKKTYYLATAMPAVCILISYLLAKTKANLTLTSIVLLAFIGLNVASIQLSDKTYWAAKRGRIAQSLVAQIKTAYPTLPPGARVLIMNDPNYPQISGDWGGSSTQANYILNGSDALQLLYDDNSLEVFYEDINPDRVGGEGYYKITPTLE